MKKKVVFKGSQKEKALYVTAVFIFDDTKEELQQEIDLFLQAFDSDGIGDAGDVEKKITASVRDNKVVLYISYQHCCVEAGPCLGSWDDGTKRDAENLIAQLELSLSCI